MNVFRLALLGLLFLAGGCTPSLEQTSRQTTKSTRALLQAYRQRSEQLQRAAEGRAARGIEYLEVDTSSIPNRVSVRLRQAALAVAVHRLLEASNRPYLYHGVQPAGTVTANFGDVPLLEALNLLLSGYGYSAVSRGGLVVLQEGAPRGAVDTASADTASADTAGAGIAELEEAEPARREVALAHLDAQTADSMLRELYPPDAPPPLRHAPHPTTNSVLLAGHGTAVREASALLRGADHAPPHVLLEALVVEFDRDLLREVGVDLTQASIWQFEDLFVQFGETIQQQLGFSLSDSVAAPRSVSVLVQALARTGDAHVLARPYVSTRSGNTAQIEIATDRYVITPTQQFGPFFTDSTPITAGVLMRMTPTVMPRGGIRVSLEVEESQFLPFTRASAAVDRSETITSMQVASGQTIVLGGLALERRTSSVRGVPFLRRIPLLNLLFSQQNRAGRDQEVAVFVTPYAWTPGLDTPLPTPDTLREEAAFPFPHEQSRD